ncbi:MAG: alpha/beta hydrolase family protein [Steroidobacterales bacterium]
MAENPPFRIGSVSAADFQAKLLTITSPITGAELIQLYGAPVCGVDIYHLTFWTLGGNSASPEVTQSSGALMVPTGASPACSGPRPIVLYAHATEFTKSLNLADVITNPATNPEGVLIAAAFAAQGFIVVAPNYAGYDISTLGYHPYLNATQQSGEMLDMLAAARTALPNTLSSATSDSGKLFVTGYSEGGHVAMATQRALLAAGKTVTAAVHSSGPYALEAELDAAVLGNVPVASTLFAPLVTTSYQHEYGNIYSATTDIYSASYATGIDTLLPSTQPYPSYPALFAGHLLPETAFFDSTTPTAATVQATILAATSNATLAAQLAVALPPLLVPPPTPILTANPLTPVFDQGFGTPYLFNDSYRILYAADAVGNPDPALAGTGAGLPATPPTNPLRLAAYKNDLRTRWAPNSPTLLCGGYGDPTIFFLNALTMQAYWSTTPAAPLVGVLDLTGTVPLPPAPNPLSAFTPLQDAFNAANGIPNGTTFQAELAYYESPAGGSLPVPQATLAAETAVVSGTHEAETPFCLAAAAGYFKNFL